MKIEVSQKALITTCAIIFCFTACLFNLHAQEFGYLEFRGRTIKNDKPLSNAKVTLSSEDEIIKELTTPKNGRFTFDIDFGRDYKMTFESEGCITSYLKIYAGDLELGKPVIFPIYQTVIPFTEDTASYINKDKFKYPFTRVIFDGKQSFMDDLDYLDNFAKGIFNEDELDKPKEEKKKRKRRLFGRIIIDDTKRTPATKVKVNLVDDNGNVIQSCYTNRKGAFSFNQLPPDGNYSISVESEEDQGLAGKSLLLMEQKGNEVIARSEAGSGGSFTFRILESQKEKLELIEEEDPSLKTMLNGLVLKSDGVAIGNANVTVTLEDGTSYTTTTNEYGEFQFKNLPSDQKYIIELSENDPALAGLNSLLIKSKDGTKTKEARLSNGSFKFSILPSDQNKLSSLYYDDNPGLANIKLNGPGKKGFPPSLSFADENSDEVITPKEVNACINKYKAGDNSLDKPNLLSLIEWYLN